MRNKNDFEILSPAGSIDALRAAVLNGADAVYLGGKSFSARKSAVNFSDEEIAEGTRYAHLYGVKVYAAVNILIHDYELKEVFDYISFLYKSGIDALIVQDLGIVYIVRKYFPDFPIHASTQMTIHNTEGAIQAQRLGFKRAVLSRELTLEEIKAISEGCGIELEVFVHGALCMSYSGQCLMSSFLGCRSGNRGACAQPCRLPYTLLDGERKQIGGSGKYPLSLKDLCLINELDALAECGVKSLKIEGRMKSSKYVSAVTAMYDKYRNGGTVSDEDMNILENIFSRSGFTQGYLFGKTGRDMLNYNKSNDDVYDNINKNVNEFAEALKNTIRKKHNVSAYVKIQLGRPAYARFCLGSIKAEVTGTVCAESAINKPLTNERVACQLSKTGNTPFEISSCDADIDENTSLPVKELNELRRRGLEILENELCRVNRAEKADIFEFRRVNGSFSEILYKAEVRTLSQAKAALECGFDTVIVPYDIYEKNRTYFDCHRENTAVLLPSVDRGCEKHIRNIGADEVYVSNISQFEDYRDKRITANYTLNVFNSLSLRVLKELGAQCACVSPELNIRQLKELDSYIDKEIIVYGRLPLMTVQNCIVKSVSGSCGCTDGAYYLKDRKGVLFPVFTSRGECTNTIYNSAPVYMADKLGDIPSEGAKSYRFIFSTESDEQIKEIYNSYKNKKTYPREFTRGHFYRGV